MGGQGSAGGRQGLALAADQATIRGRANDVPHLHPIRGVSKIQPAPARLPVHRWRRRALHACLCLGGRRHFGRGSVPASAHGAELQAPRHWVDVHDLWDQMRWSQTEMRVAPLEGGRFSSTPALPRICLDKKAPKEKRLEKAARAATTKARCARSKERATPYERPWKSRTVQPASKT